MRILASLAAASFVTVTSIARAQTPAPAPLPPLPEPTTPQVNIDVGEPAPAATPKPAPAPASSGTVPSTPESTPPATREPLVPDAEAHEAPRFAKAGTAVISTDMQFA